MEDANIFKRDDKHTLIPFTSSALKQNDLPLDAFSDINLRANAVDTHVGFVRLNWGRANATQRSRLRKPSNNVSKRHKDIHLQVDLSHFGYPWLDNEKEELEKEIEFGVFRKLGVFEIGTSKNRRTLCCVFYIYW